MYLGKGATNLELYLILDEEKLLVGEGNPSKMSLDDTQQKGWEPQEEDISKPKSSNKKANKKT